jgi:hypothetical protein
MEAVATTTAGNKAFRNPVVQPPSNRRGSPSLHDNPTPKRADPESFGVTFHKKFAQRHVIGTA